MIPSIDYLTLVISGSILLAGASDFFKSPGTSSRSGFVLAVLGLFLFIVGTVRAFQSAFGL